MDHRRCSEHIQARYPRNSESINRQQQAGVSKEKDSPLSGILHDTSDLQCLRCVDFGMVVYESIKVSY